MLKALRGFASSMDTDVTLCRVEEIPDGGMKHFEIMGYDVMVVRLGDQFYCVDEACTYKWAMLTDGHVDRERLAIVCKDCNGAWDLRTGQPKDPPAKFPLNAYRIEAEGDDLIVTFTY
jgi:3-phenylpropionate/trans-cinnamate dioxygenase ferredoxin subunit